MSIAVDARRAFVLVAEAEGVFRESRRRASQPAPCGVAADVPVNGDPKPPTPLTVTSSAAAQVGPGTVWFVPAPSATQTPRSLNVHTVVEISCTGPPLEYGSMAPAPCASSAASDV